MTDERGFDDLEARADGLNETLGQTSSLMYGFDAELQRMKASLQATGRDVAILERSLSRGLKSAFDGVIFDGMNLSDALNTVANSMINATYNAAIKPVTNQLGGLLASGVGGLVDNILPFADGAPFSQGRVMPFATGGIVSGATPFGMRGGMGVMGEAGPEAIMPLARGPDGKLGVRGAAGGGGNTIVMNISTPDVQGFQRSQGQIAAQMTRALSRGQRNR
ncbi:phage tail tape measure protein [uncultured Roseobacter sp.]|uniref:phage tail tape measure protein n=1 Tax=uncultured Roseobacter sp. TaxID=114847 RepID=UPI00262867D3|nr:phage tail tape measure protein [uncultured Roseobacter sp.]